MKRSWHFGLLTLFTGIVVADELPLPGSELEKATYVASIYQSEISFQSKRLPAWEFGVRYDKEVPYHEQWVDSINAVQPIDSVKVSASRSIVKNSTQRIFAALQTSNDDRQALVDWLYVPANAGTAASVGWQIGNMDSLKMAVEYQYREVSDKDINSLQLGVYYYF